MAVNTPRVAPFPVDTVLTGITLAYCNNRLIADEVLPRVPVGGRLFKWNEFDTNDRLTIPETLVGRKGQPNEVEFGYSEKDSSVRDYGLDDVIPNDDITNAPPNFSPLGNATEGLTDLILLDREVRVAKLVFNPDSYATGFKETLSGTDQWDNPASDPKNQILDALDKMLMRPNIAVLGQAVYTKLRQNPSMVSAALGNSGTAGTLTHQQLAALLEVDEVIVGSGYVNMSKPGQPPQMVRVWGNSAAFIYRNRLANSQRGVTFGFTAQWQSRVSGQWAEPKIGLRGAVRVRVGESVRELIVAKDAGYFFENVISD